MTSSLPSDAHPGYAHAEAELKTAADTGTKAIIDAIGAMAILGEMQRLRDRLDMAGRLLRCIADGRSCWASTTHGLEACEVPGVGEFLVEQPVRKRWWRR
jgi:hypothetical protein